MQLLADESRQEQDGSVQVVRLGYCEIFVRGPGEFYLGLDPGWSLPIEYVGYFK